MTREVLVGLLVVALSAGGLGFLWHREATRGLRFQLEFEDGAGLKAGDSVFLQGVDVGEVLDVELGADRKVRVLIRLSDRFKALVPADAQFLIASDKFLFSKKAILVMPTASPGAAVQEGQVIRGVEGYTDLYMNKGTARARKVWDRFKGWLKTDEDSAPEPEKK